jgi:hypothetical protein
MDYVVVLVCIMILFVALGVLLGRPLKKEKESLFPFRLLCNEKNEPIPVVALTAFFRTDTDRKRYREYLSNGTKVIGYTSYKTFPKGIKDGTGDDDSVNDPFQYTSEIKNWVCCFKDPKAYGFTEANTLLEMSESDFKDAVPHDTVKKYDFMYVCLQDEKDSCPLNGWNAVNRNFNLALKCFPIMVHQFNLKILVIGRLNCGLEEMYGDSVHVIGFLPWEEFQEKMRESRYLFVPNVYDASPRVVTEAISQDIPVLMNRHIVCGSKYITPETGELFTDENDVAYHVNSMLTREMHPQRWWQENYSNQASGIKFRDFLAEVYPDVPEVQAAQEVHFL